MTEKSKIIYGLILIVSIVSSELAWAKKSKNKSVPEPIPSSTPSSAQIKSLFEVCEAEAIKRIALIEVKDEQRFSEVRFDSGLTEISVTEMPDMSGEGRRRRRGRKQPPPQPIGPSKVGYNMIVHGVAQEKAGVRKVLARCMLYKSKLVTVTYELDALGSGTLPVTTSMVPVITTTTTTPIQPPTTLAPPPSTSTPVAPAEPASK